jgi:uncharacterized protein YjiS (DUF1127 family)
MIWADRMLEALSRANGRLTTGAGSFAVKRIIEAICEWQRRASSRRDLMALAPRDLRDLRLTRADALREARKSFWTE